MSNLLGKMLRINKDGTIPTDNPFYASTTGKQPRDLGARPAQSVHLRVQPRRHANCSSTTSDRTRGRKSTTASPAPTTGGRRPRARRLIRVRQSRDTRTTTPAARARSPAARSTLRSRLSFRPTTASDYFFADYCGGWIRKLDPAAGNTVADFATGISFPVDLKVADDGSLYYLARGTGATTGVVYRVDYGTAAPSITAHPASQTVAPGASATFSVRASGPPPLRYQWQRNGANIAGATAQDYTLASVVPADNGARFRAQRHQRLRQRRSATKRC